ncbi:Ribulose-phosphate 3-epimerase [Pelomyxa schiedti]|nr:Ribulose-phosphate 3-epimerase [Pelomyxa schiedti]
MSSSTEGVASARPVRVAPSLLSGDFARLGEDAKLVLDQGADWLHIDVMDGHFVPNLTIGAPVVKSLRKALPTAFFDCHLMVTHPEKWVTDFKNSGASQYTFHIEATENRPEGSITDSLIDSIKAAGMRVGIAVKPNTPISSVFPYANKVDMILVMTVEPGFGGQSFMANMMPKVAEIRTKFPSVDIQVDGGIDTTTVHQASQAGANIMVAGTAVFRPSGGLTMHQVIEAIKRG